MGGSVSRRGSERESSTEGVENGGAKMAGSTGRRAFDFEQESRESLRKFAGRYERCHFFMLLGVLGISTH
jgi:hypothetical protein